MANQHSELLRDRIPSAERHGDDVRLTVDEAKGLLEQFEVLHEALTTIATKFDGYGNKAYPARIAQMALRRVSNPASAPGIQNFPESGDLSVSGSRTSGDDAGSVTPALPGAEPSPATESALTAEPMNPAGSGAPDADSVPAKRPV